MVSSAEDEDEAPFRTIQDLARGASAVERENKYLASDYETLLKLSEAQSRRLEKRFLTKEKTWTADKERLEETLRKERSDFSEMASKLKQLTAMEEETDRIRSALIATDQAMVEN